MTESNPDQVRRIDLNEPQGDLGIPPPPPESFLASQIEEYLESAPEDQQKALSSPEARKDILRELAKLEDMLALVDRMSAVATHKAEQMGLTEARDLKDSFLRRHIASACRMVALERKNITLRDENEVLIQTVQELQEENGELKIRAGVVEPAGIPEVVVDKEASLLNTGGHKISIAESS